MKLLLHSSRKTRRRYQVGSALLTLLSPMAYGLILQNAPDISTNNKILGRPEFQSTILEGVLIDTSWVLTHYKNRNLNHVTLIDASGNASQVAVDDVLEYPIPNRIDFYTGEWGHVLLHLAQPITSGQPIRRLGDIPRTKVGDKSFFDLILLSHTQSGGQYKKTFGTNTGVFRLNRTFTEMDYADGNTPFEAMPEVGDIGSGIFYRSAENQPYRLLALISNIDSRYEPSKPFLNANFIAEQIIGKPHAIITNDMIAYALGIKRSAPSIGGPPPPGPTGGPPPPGPTGGPPPPNTGGGAGSGSAHITKVVEDTFIHKAVAELQANGQLTDYQEIRKLLKAVKDNATFDEFRGITQATLLVPHDDMMEFFIKKIGKTWNDLANLDPAKVNQLKLFLKMITFRGNGHNAGDNVSNLQGTSFNWQSDHIIRSGILGAWWDPAKVKQVDGGNITVYFLTSDTNPVGLSDASTLADAFLDGGKAAAGTKTTFWEQ